MGNILEPISQGEPGIYEREQAKTHAESRADAFERSKQCYRVKDHEGAKKWSEQGKYHDRMVKKYNGQASDAIFQSKNVSRDIEVIDLHGLFVEEAKVKVEKHITICKKRKIKSFTIIVGKGIHSKTGIAKLKPAIMELLERYSLRCTVDERNEGCLIVEFVSEKSRVGFFGLDFSMCLIM